MNGNKETENWEHSRHQESGKTPQRMGRPREFSDEDAFIATARAVKASGYRTLTLNAIASELGCSAPALQSRFGSRSRLLQAFLQWGNGLAADGFRRVRQEHQSPLEALRERFRYPESGRVESEIEVGDLSNHFNLLGFHVAAWSDPDLHELEKSRRQIFEEGIVALLNDALTGREIGGCDPQILGKLILAAIVGSELQWVSRPEPVTDEYLVDVIEELIRPYRMTHGDTSISPSKVTKRGFVDDTDDQGCIGDR